MLGELVMGGVAAASIVTGAAFGAVRLYRDNGRWLAARQAAIGYGQEMARADAFDADVRALFADRDRVVEDEALADERL